MATLYVVEQGAQLGRDGQRLVVRRAGQEIASRPLHLIDQVVLLGRIQPTTSALETLLQNGIPLFYLSERGVLKGSLQPPLGKHVLLRRKQYQLADDPAFCTQFAHAVVAAKLANQRGYCLRWSRDHRVPAADEAAQAIAGTIRQLARHHDLPHATLRGLEGTGARAYYSALRALVGRHMPFGRRTRRPAIDPVSALLNLASGLLRVQVLTALSLSGLDPYQGFYHKYSYGRPALALDLMEEFRPLLADAVAVATIDRHIVGPDDFVPGAEGGVLLSENALERFVALSDARLRETISHPVTRHQINYRQALQLQTRVLVKAILGELPGYVAFELEH